MMRDIKDLQSFWRDNAPHPLTLCTIVGKSGSGYRQIGAKKIVRRDGVSCGYLSGGCLEGHIVTTACENWDRTPFCKSFSTMSEEDRLIGYQTGCAGIIDILFERLPNSTDDMTRFLPYGNPEKDVAVAVSLDEKTLGQRTLLAKMPEKHGEHVFIDPWIRPLHLYMIGCGPNAWPFAQLAQAIGWDLTFLDYRHSNRIEIGKSTPLIVPLNEIAGRIQDGPRNAVVLMTHNYEADVSILSGLNGRNFGYIGCVGPRKRFEQMKADLQNFHGMTIDENWARAVHAPPGLYQGRSPETIALAIVAQIQTCLES